MNWREVMPNLYAECGDEVKSAFEPIITKVLNDAPAANSQRTFVHMLGIPGAGKSTFWQKNKKAFADFIFVGFDTLMAMLPEYQKDVENLGLKEAFARWELPARIAGYELLIRAMEQKKNIFFDHGGSPELHLEIMRAAKVDGYHTKMYYIKCDVETALQRTTAREKEIQRHTPEKLIIERYPLVEKRATQFKEIVDEFIEI